MARSIPENELKAIVTAVGGERAGLSAREIANRVSFKLPTRTLQFRLRRLVETGRLRMLGQRKQARYIVPPTPQGSSPLPVPDIRLMGRLNRSPRDRPPVGYNRAFLDAYRPGVSAYLSTSVRSELARTACPASGPLPVGTYIRQILPRLSIDLAWNSSRLEGSTYTRLETQYLLELGREAEGKQIVESQIVVNHNDAISFLVENPREIGVDRYTVQNLHAILAMHQSGDIRAPGRPRRVPLTIEGSAFRPLDRPWLIEECLDLILAKAKVIADPFEQSFFLMVHLLYLQPFEDLNNCVSRLAANIPFIKRNLAPLSFAYVPRELYLAALVGGFELNDISLLRDLYIWAYKRSASWYTSAGPIHSGPDFFRLRHRKNIRRIVNELMRARVDRIRAPEFISRWMAGLIEADDQQRFRQTIEDELLALDAGNSARYRVTLSEFEAWRKAWSAVGPPAAADSWGTSQNPRDGHPGSCVTPSDLPYPGRPPPD